MKDKQPNRPIALVQKWHDFVEAQRLRLAYFDALPQLTLLGIATGLLAGAVIILFRWVVETGTETLFPMDTEEGFESLPAQWRFLIAVAGGLIVGLLFHFAASSARDVGVVHVIERLNYYQGHLPFRNALLQFVGAAVSIICGHSVGREGPNIHLGAASASLLGRRLVLPNNSIRTLVGCGVAAAIAAGFNTPLAGVIFAMEVVLMEYTIIGFVPIIVAAVSATALTRAVYGEQVVFFVYTYHWDTLRELLYVLALGIVIGVLAAVFIRLTLWISDISKSVTIWLRLTIAGGLVGLIAIPLPEVMGIGYDTVRSALHGELFATALILIAVGKLLATSACIGLGSPGGLIAPTLFIGATTGGALGWLTIDFFDVQIADGFYAMLGMGAMMAATLQAPLAALLAMLELTANPKLIMPGMIAVVSAVLVTRVVFRCPSIYQLIMQKRGLDYRNDPVAQTLRRVGVTSVMDRKIGRASRHISRTDALVLLQQEGRWILIVEDEEPRALLSAADLARFIEGSEEQAAIDLLDIPAMRKDLIQTDVLASLQEALDLLDKSGMGAVYITGAKGAELKKIYGVLTREDIEKSYR